MNEHFQRQKSNGGRASVEGSSGTRASGAISPLPLVSRGTGESDATTPASEKSQVDAAARVATGARKQRGENIHQQGAEKLSAVKSTDGQPDQQPDSWRVPEATISQVLTFIACGYSLRQAAAAVGRSHSTFVKLQRRDPKFACRLLQHRQLARDKPLRQVLQASERSWRAAAWLLKYLDAQERKPHTRRAGSVSSLNPPRAKDDGRIGNPSSEAMSLLGHRGTSDVSVVSLEREAGDEK